MSPHPARMQHTAELGAALFHSAASEREGTFSRVHVYKA